MRKLFLSVVALLCVTFFAAATPVQKSDVSYPPVDVSYPPVDVSYPPVDVS